MPFRRGFKSQCERRAAEFRKQFGLSDQGALSADRLAKELRVTVWSTSEVAGLTPTVLSVLNDKTDQSWSALTMRLGASHLVVFKPVSSNGRRNNVIMHELAHIILGHELATACILEDGSLATVLAGIRRKHARPPVQKEAILAEDILNMIDTLGYRLRDMRDRAILLIGYAGGLRRSEIVSLDINRDDTDDGKGWIAIEERGLILTFRGKTGWREVEIGRGSSDQTCPVHALEQYLHYSRIDFGPLFQRVSRDDRKPTGARLSDKHVARLIKKTVLDAGIRSDLPEAERVALFSGHSLRAGLASSAEVDERYIQKQLGHASAEMTRRYQRRRDRFRVNLTKAAGL